METQAYFENIQEHLIDELSKAKSIIHVAVAWFTDTLLFEKLCDKAQKGIKVRLIVDDNENNINSNNDYKFLKQFEGEVYFIKGMNDRLMHNKYCVIDYNTVITGSYNWSYYAQENDENITVINGDSNLAWKFIENFDHVIERHTGKRTKAPIDLSIILKRLNIIRTFIELEEIEEIKKQSIRLQYAKDIERIRNILSLLQASNYTKALEEIEFFVQENTRIVKYIDPRVSALKLEIKAIELQISALNDELVDKQKLIHDFNVMHNQLLGKLILKILELKKLLAKTDDKKKEAKKDYQDYKQQHEEIQKKDHFILNEEEQKILKKNYRKAVKICHPDIVNDEFKSQAEAMFVELQRAYESNNLERVNEILENLELGNAFSSKSENIDESSALEMELTRLRLVLRDLEKEIKDIESSAPYQTISVIDDWEKYFKTQREKLSELLGQLEKEHEAEQQ